MGLDVSARLRSTVSPRLRWRDYRSEAARMMRAGEFVGADRVLSRGLTACPDHPELLIDHALSAHNSGRYALAVERWERAKRIASHKAMCHAGLAANLRELGELARAREIVKVGLRRFPSHVAIIIEAARLAAAEGRYEEAANFWGRAAARRRAHPDWLRGHAQCLSLLGRFEEARQVLEAALKRFPGELVAEVAPMQDDGRPILPCHRPQPFDATEVAMLGDPTGWDQLGLSLQSQRE